MTNYECTLCPAGEYTTNNKSHMKSHLGSKRRDHNYGPWLCGYQGCNERAVRNQKNEQHGTPIEHKAQFARDVTLDRELNTMVLHCEVTAESEED